eukprot:GHVQ01008579.1.p1 GENE.GHVQ01008579.1~~GHVQ01008579.1.p1  ORF type:complete len:453 (-),score=62.21 GHVQ01008579.1:154-1512(-)
MTTFVPLAADIDGTVSAVAIGDWLLQLIKAKKPDFYKQFYSEFLELAQSLDPSTNVQVIGDPLGLFKLLLSQEELVMEWLKEAFVYGEVTVVVAVSPEAGSAEQAKEKEVRKSYPEVLREVEEMYSVLMAMLVLRVTDVEAAGMAAGQLCEVFKKSTTEMTEFRLKLLMSLYNIFPPTFPYRFPIFVATLEYAAETNLFHIMLPYIAYIDEWMKDWQLDGKAKRGVFIILARQLNKLNKIDEAYPFLRRHVEGFQGETAEELRQPATIEAAADLAADSIRHPDIMHFDKLLQMDAIKQLRDSPAHVRLVELLEIFLRGGPNDFMRFYEANKSLFEHFSLSYASCLSKIRLLSLASRCVGRCELSLKELADVLGLTDRVESVEEIVVQAIGLGLLDAKIDQINKTVQITSAMQREFGRGEWEKLLNRLHTWSENVNILRLCVREGGGIGPVNA